MSGLGFSRDVSSRGLEGLAIRCLLVRFGPFRGREFATDLPRTRPKDARSLTSAVELPLKKALQISGGGDSNPRERLRGTMVIETACSGTTAIQGHSTRFGHSDRFNA